MYSVLFDPNRHMKSLPPLLTHLYRSEYLNLSYLESLNDRSNTCLRVGEKCNLSLPVGVLFTKVLFHDVKICN